MPIVLARVDQRIIHGQIMLSCALAKRKVNGVIVVDASLSGDEALQRIFDGGLAVADPPFEEGAAYVDPADLPELLKRTDSAKRRFLVIFRDISSALEASAAGCPLDSLNLGNFCSDDPEAREIYQGFKAAPGDIEVLDELARRIPRVYFGPLDESLQRYPAPGAPRGAGA
jgi:mannose/fructose/N-acetylgalactosamine-specific phosphotransferase system component IIB